MDKEEIFDRPFLILNGVDFEASLVLISVASDLEWDLAKVYKAYFLLIVVYEQVDSQRSTEVDAQLYSTIT